VQARPRPWLTVEADAYARRAAHVLVPDDVYRTRDGLVGPGIEVGALLGQYTPATEKAYGVEMRSVTERGPWQLRLGGAVARTLVRVADPGTTPQPEGFRPSDLDVPVSMQAALSWRAGRWEATLAADVRSGDPISEPVARYRLDDVVGDAPDGTDGPTTYLYRPQINNGRLPMYVRFDGMLAYRFRALTANWRARLTVYNITNRANVVTRRFEPLAAGVRTSDRRGLPILPLLELEMTL
jgi:outer membrane receptor protein involved in Fe transport